MSREEVRSLLERARRSLRSAHNLLEDGDNDFAVARAYYAMFHAAKAALLVRDIKRSNHAGVISAFGQHLVKAGPFTPAHQKMLQAAFRDRIEGDYAGTFPSREDVERRLEEARQFLEAVADFLGAEGLGGE